MTELSALEQVSERMGGGPVLGAVQKREESEHGLGLLEPHPSNLRAVAGVPPESGSPVLRRGSIEEEETKLEGFSEPDVRKLSSG